MKISFMLASTTAASEANVNIVTSAKVASQNLHRILMLTPTTQNSAVLRADDLCLFLFTIVVSVM